MVALDTAPGRTARPYRRLALAGLVAVPAAAVATAVVAGLARTLGADLEIPDGGETIPPSGIAFVTGVFSVAGLLLAAALLRWSARPEKRFVQATVALTALSLVPPFLSGGAASTVATLVVLHLLAAGVVIPVVTRSLRAA